MSKTLKLIAVFIVINVTAFSQKKDSLPIGMTRESDYKRPFSFSSPILSEFYSSVVVGDSAKRLYSISIKGDTATITIDKLPEILKGVNIIKIGERYFKRWHDEAEPIYFMYW